MTKNNCLHTWQGCGKKRERERENQLGMAQMERGGGEKGKQERSE